MEPKPTVRTPSTAVDAMSRDWELASDLLGGTDAMREAGKRRLPQWPREGDNSYALRLAVATLFPGYGRTIEVLSGKPFAKPVTVSDDVPAEIRAWCSDIDLAGRDLHAFAASALRSALGYGVAGILVDCPQASGIRTRAQEMAAGVRPYLVEVAAQNIVGWRSERVGGSERLTQLRLLETVIETDGEWGDQAVEQVRVLYPDAWQVWRKAAPDEDRWIVNDEGTSTLGEVPFVALYGRRLGFLQSVPPLLELAHLNVQHWQSASDQQTILHVARVPMLFAKLIQETDITVGAASAILGSDPQSDLKYVEHSGKAIEAGRLELLDIEDRMRQIGAELLVVKPGNTSTSQTIADAEPGMSVLQAVVQDAEQAIGRALGLMSKWIGQEPAGIVTIYQDFGVQSLAEASMSLLRQMQVDRTLSSETLFSEAQRRGILRPELAWAEEKGRIAQDTPPPDEQTQVKITG